LQRHQGARVQPDYLSSLSTAAVRGSCLSLISAEGPFISAMTPSR
jgi:hypothetical protein